MGRYSSNMTTGGALSLRVMHAGHSAGGAIAITVAAQCELVRSLVLSEPNLDPGFPRPNNFFTQVSYQQVKAALPTIAGEKVDKKSLAAEFG